jgi:hypothetical protein
MDETAVRSAAGLITLNLFIVILGNTFMSNDIGPLPTSFIPLMTPTKARNIAGSLKSLAEEYAGIGMHQDEADCMMRGSEWWLAYAMTLEHAKDAKK